MEGEEAWDERYSDSGKVKSQTACSFVENSAALEICEALTFCLSVALFGAVIHSDVAMSKSTTDSSKVNPLVHAVTSSVYRTSGCMHQGVKSFVLFEENL